MPLTVGTAGHIDHGKTTLVEALTGKNTDRLPEEQERGISIDLGYAPLELPDGTQLSVVDVPGHERFVRTMVAGATGIDLFLLVIDANEGARPQTHEHLAILRLLGIERGVVALTKADLVDEETLELARAEAEELVPGAPVVAVSARTGAGLDELRAALASIAAERAARRCADPALRRSRVHAARDRHGRDRNALVRARSAKATSCGSAGAPCACAACRCTTAPSSARRPGSALPSRCPASSGASSGAATRSSRPGAYPSSYRLDIALEPLAEIPARVHVHHGTANVLARVVRVGERFAQLRLAEPVVAARGDRLVLRAATTVGGGRVLDPSPPRHASLERMELVERGEIAATVHEPVRAESLAHLGELAGVERGRRLGLLDARGSTSCAPSSTSGSSAPIRSTRASRRRRSAWAGAVVPLLGLERRGAKLYRPGATAELGERAEAAAAALEAQLGLEPVKVEDAALGALPRGAGPPRARRRRLRDLRRGVRAGARRARRRVRGAPAGSRSRASATCSASAARRRSSCSSASTPTG